MSEVHPRIRREKKTVEVMIRIYCHKHKHPRDEGELCTECSELLEYAHKRLDRCPFQEKKTTCAKCPVHCYEPSMKTKIRTVMRYSGPRMLTRHPVLAFHHIIDGFKKPEKLSRRNVEPIRETK